MIQIDTARFPTKRCERCGQTFTKQKKESASNWDKHRYCSLSCINAGRIKKPIIERLLENIEIITETGCWIWMRTIDASGHGKLGTAFKQANARAHRVSYEHFIGEIPNGYSVMHTCKVGACCNPNHLTLKKYHRRPAMKIPKSLRTMTESYVVIDGRRQTGSGTTLKPRTA